MDDGLCPACNHWSYKCDPGSYAGDGQKLEPDVFFCTHCGFGYSEHVKTSEREEAKEYRELQAKAGKKGGIRDVGKDRAKAL